MNGLLNPDDYEKGKGSPEQRQRQRGLEEAWERAKPAGSWKVARPCTSSTGVGLTITMGSLSKMSGTVFRADERSAATEEQLTNEQAALQAEVKREKQLAAMEESADELAEGRLTAAVDHAYSMAESARVWAERASSIVDATRAEQADQEAVLCWQLNP
eukprot:Skav201201  [mRNA]  locus=scaffold633:598101:604554:- [translate_table: standard]